MAAGLAIRGISIHSARVGGDGIVLTMLLNPTSFQSTPPVWAETHWWRPGLRSAAFQSTPPVWAETIFHRAIGAILQGFQSTPPVWAETHLRRKQAQLHLFQSTPPVWAETESDCSLSYCLAYFNPLRPCGRRPMFDTCNRLDYDISIHSARVGGDTCGRST